LARATRFVLLIWLFMALVLSNAYKGILFSLLTKPVIPVVPGTIEEVVAFGYFTATVSKIKNKVKIEQIN